MSQKELSTVQWVSMVLYGEKRMTLIHATFDGGTTLCNRAIPSDAHNECPLFDSSFHKIECLRCSKQAKAFINIR